jgi:alkylation response protein AidB-like acyl-CoA dehydrogenase
LTNDTGTEVAATAEFLSGDRAALEAFLPGLLAELSSRPLMALEKADGRAIELFRSHCGPGLLVPREHGGLGASPVDAVRAQRALGCAGPSLAIATTMHHFSVATLVELSTAGGGFEWVLLEGIAEQNRLVASGFAEGQTGQSILKPKLDARRTARGYAITGSKKPCSLSSSMDLLSASVRLEDGSTGVALVAADAPGIERRPFWATPILGGAESDEIVLADVEVEEDLVIRLDTGTGLGGNAESRGFIWFELLMTASYLGIASGLAERVLRAQKVSELTRLTIATELEAGAAALEGVARDSMAEQSTDMVLSRALLVRYAVQDAIARAVAASVEALGGMAFISSPDVAYLASAARALAFHPPGRDRTSTQLIAALMGEPLVVG